MKRLFPLLAATILTLGVGSSVFASDLEPEKEAASTQIIVNKKIEVTGNAAVFPAETLNFTSTADQSNPDTTNLTIAPLTVTGKELEVQIPLPAYTKAGVYKYTISETPGSTQGVVYGTETVAVSVLVGYNDAGTLGVLEAGVTKPEDGDKQDTITNTYNIGSLEVSKTVEGNLGDKNKLFDIDVVLTASGPVMSDITVSGGSDSSNSQTIAGSAFGTDGKTPVTATIKLKHGETVKFTNLPAGITYTVTEQEKHTAEQTNVNSEEGYSVQYNPSDKGQAIAAGDVDTVEVKNTKGTTIDTGITLDSLPYIGLLALVLAIAVVWVLRRRAAAE